MSGKDDLIVILHTAPVEGLAAEWVVERPMTLPTDPDPMTLYPLPRFGEAMFEDPVAAATASGRAGRAAQAGARSVGWARARS